MSAYRTSTLFRVSLPIAAGEYREKNQRRGLMTGDSRGSDPAMEPNLASFLVPMSIELGPLARRRPKRSPN